MVTLLSFLDSDKITKLIMYRSLDIIKSQQQLLIAWHPVDSFHVIWELGQGQGPRWVQQ